MNFSVISGIVAVVIFISIFSVIISIFTHTHRGFKDSMEDVFKNVNEKISKGFSEEWRIEETEQNNPVVCEYCGATLEQDESTCSKCGARVTKNRKK